MQINPNLTFLLLVSPASSQDCTRPCLNGGTCRASGSGTSRRLSCSCPSGYTGAYCEKGEMEPEEIIVLWVSLKLFYKN